jgi:hypothetical protein
MKQELYSGPTNIRRSRKKFNRQCQLVPATYAPLLQVRFKHKDVQNVILGIKPCTLFCPVTSQRAKMKIHKTIIRPVVTYSSETWALTAKDENNLRTFERQILRKIYGPVNIHNIWRI